MDTYPITLYMVVTSSQQHAKNWADCLYGLNSGFLNLLVHKFNKCLIAKSNQCMLGLLRTFKLANKSYIISYSSIGQPWEIIWNRDLNWTIFWFPSPKGLLICYMTKFGPHWAHNHMFLKWAQSLAMYSLPFFTPSRSKSQATILWLTRLVRIAHLHLKILSLFSNKEQTLHFTIWIIPPPTTNPSAHGNFTTHFAWNFLLLSHDFLRSFFPMPSTPSSCFFPRGLTWGSY